MMSVARPLCSDIRSSVAMVRELVKVLMRRSPMLVQFRWYTEQSSLMGRRGESDLSGLMKEGSLGLDLVLKRA